MIEAATANALVARARDAIDEGGKNVAVFAPGIPGIVMARIDPADSDGLVKMIGQLGEAEGRVFYVPSTAIQCISTGDELY